MNLFQDGMISFQLYTCVPNCHSVHSIYNSKLTSLLDNTPLDSNLVNFIEIRKKQRKDNILNIINSGDFFCGFKNRSLDVLKNNKVKTDFKEQIKILMRSIDAEQRLECFDYWEQEKTKASYKEESFVDEILDMHYNFLE